MSFNHELPPSSLRSSRATCLPRGPGHRATRGRDNAQDASHGLSASPPNLKLAAAARPAMWVRWPRAQWSKRKCRKRILCPHSDARAGAREPCYAHLCLSNKARHLPLIATGRLSLPRPRPRRLHTSCPLASWPLRCEDRDKGQPCCSLLLSRCQSRRWSAASALPGGAGCNGGTPCSLPF